MKNPVEEAIEIISMMMKVQYTGPADTLATLTVDGSMEEQGEAMSVNHKEILDVFTLSTGDKVWYGLRQQAPDEGKENDYIVLTTENYLRYTQDGIMVEIDLEDKG